MQTSYRDSHKSQETGETYGNQFSDRSNVACLYWQLEQNELKKIAFGLPFKLKTISALDFACGSGRISRLLHDLGARTIGVDISSAMLQSAERLNSGPTYICCDLTAENNPLAGQYQLITAFRFFPHAEPSLRNEALETLRSLLSDNGVLIINNHRNPNCIWTLLGQFFIKRKKTSICDLDDAKIQILMSKHSLSVFKKISYGFLPFRREVSKGFSVFVKIETFLGRLLYWTDLGRCNMYVIAKSKTPKHSLSARP